MTTDHVFLDTRTCPCRGDDSDRVRRACPVCDGGLLVCSICGAAGGELKGSCNRIGGAGLLASSGLAAERLLCELERINGQAMSDAQLEQDPDVYDHSWSSEASRIIAEAILIGTR